MSRLQSLESWHSGWLRTVLEIDENSIPDPNADATRTRINECIAHLYALANGDRAIVAKLLSALRIDPELHKRWIVSERLLDRLEAAHEHSAHSTGAQ